MGGGLKTSSQHHEIMRRVFEFTLAIFLVLTATAYTAGQQFSVVQGKVFQIGTAALFIMSLYLKPLRFVSNKWVNGCVGLALITSILQPPQALSVAIEGLVFCFMGIALFYVVINHVERMDFIFNAICAVVLLDAFIIALQIMKMDPVCLNDGGLKNTHMVGLFGFKYVLGSYMALVAPVLICSKRYIFGILAAILTVCSMSWAAVGALGVSLIVTSAFVNKKIFIASTSLIVIAGISLYFGYFKSREMVEAHKKGPDRQYVVDSNGNYMLEKVLRPDSLPYKIKTRIHLEGKFLPVLFSKPVTGYGLGSFKYIGPRIDTYPYGTMVDAWNDYLERGIECGIFMIALMIWTAYDVIRRFKRSRKSIALIGIFASLITIPFGMMFHDYLNHFSLTALSLVLFALYEIKIKESEDVYKVCG